ncbi:cytochrome c biogenesis protein ResB [Propionicimonas sp.]|uniref:cytochrome c biogenesis protein ResB n=1 Tax=Propionicimonas sp. TaxID=1955623 RepID=UPI0039C9C829
MGEAMVPEQKPQAPKVHVGRELVSWLRFAWTTLTSMRTALILLLVLGIAAIPGSLLPQRPTSPIGVSDYLAANPVVGPWLDRLGFFDVFGSVWFAAIYLLLFISLIGCILPRTAVYLKALRDLPSAPPGALDRLPGHTAGTVTRTPEDVLDAAETNLRSRHYRVRRDADGISAERGYLRETGNLVFHICLVLTLIGLAWGSLFSFKGTAIVVEGQAFSNTLTQYDDFGAGAGFAPSQLSPFTVKLDDFRVTFETGPVQQGAARDFTAHVSVTGADGATSQQVLQVNGPLAVGSNNVHLLGHGYAPVVTVRDGSGNVAFSGPVVFLPQDSNFRSEGVIKAPDARPQRLAFEGIFLPTASSSGSGGLVSVFPDALNPQLLVNVWAGPPKVETGAPENVYALDKTGLTQLTKEGGDPLRAGLEVGTTYQLPDGQGSLSFDGWKRWTKLQISSAPGGWLVLVSVMLAVLGMAVSLSVRPRRLFVRVRTGTVPHDGAERPPAGEAGTIISVAGLDRVEGRGGLTEEVAALAAACGLEATLAPTAGGEPTSDERADDKPANDKPTNDKPTNDKEEQ